MADRTSIEVTEATWNPITGCTPVSPGCRRCYAARFAKRLAGRYGYPEREPFRVTVHQARMAQPLMWRKPRHVFVCSMGDLFHEDVPDEALQQVFEIMAEQGRHTYMILTKRAERMARWLTSLEPGLRRRLRWNLWVGVTAEDQQTAEERVPPLVECWDGLRFACLEPLLSPVDLRPWLDLEHGVSWVICGGETGPGGRVADEGSVRLARDRCAAAGVPFYFKQWGGPSKKKTGRVLDGRTWDEMPPY